MRHIQDKLRILQREDEAWEKRKIWHMNKELAVITKELLDIRPHLMRQYLPDVIRSQIQVLELQRKKLLHIKETTWRLRSRGIWIWERDQNTKFFHRYANYKHRINFIWEISNSNGNNL